MDPNIFKVVRPCLWFAAGDVLHSSMLVQYFTAKAIDDLMKSGYLSQEKQLLPPLVHVLYGERAVEAYEEGVDEFIRFAEEGGDVYEIKSYTPGTSVITILEDVDGWQGSVIIPPKDYEQIVAAIA